MAKQKKYSAEQKYFYESARKAEAETSNRMIAKLEESRVTRKVEEYYIEQIKQLKAMNVKTESETTNMMIARLEESRVTKRKEEYYAEQIKQIKVNTTKVEAETKILVEHVDKAHSQGHLYNAGTTLACLGCITGLSVLGVQGFKKVQELRG